MRGGTKESNASRLYCSALKIVLDDVDVTATSAASYGDDGLQRKRGRLVWPFEQTARTGFEQFSYFLNLNQRTG
jgi:hypothetical protein